MIKPIEWTSEDVILIDQTKLPLIKEYVHCKSYETIAHAIKTMQLRGAPAIGVAAAFGLALVAKNSLSKNNEELLNELEKAGKILQATRPTAYNLFWAIEQVINTAKENKDRVPEELKAIVIEKALQIREQDEQMCRSIGHFGSQLVKDNMNILTHCNAGSLATAAFGTALGVIFTAFEQGKKIHVFVDETRPLLQGARLTAWELKEEGVPFTLITDNMAGFLMQKGKIDFVVVGADRITANGDIANKIGTYSVAVLAKAHGIPFYSAAPYSTFDPACLTGDDIVIEERKPEEVTHIQGVPTAPLGVKVYNPAFDVTPNRYLSGIITERGIAYPPFADSLKELSKQKVLT